MCIHRICFSTKILCTNFIVRRDVGVLYIASVVHINIVYVAGVRKDDKEQKGGRKKAHVYAHNTYCDV